MLSGLRDVLSRHRRKCIVASAFAGGAYFAFKYAQKKFFEMQERETIEFLEKSRRMQHFTSTEITCNQLIIDMGTELLEAILKQCSTDELLKQMREKPANKVELWEEMKIITFTRLVTIIYASSMMVVSLRIQLNLLAGYLYSSNASTLVGGQSKDGNKEQIDCLKEEYLLLSKYFINEGGLEKLIRLIRLKVAALLKPIPLDKSLSLSDVEQLFWSLQMEINSDPSVDPCSKMSKYLLPFHLSDFVHGGPLLQQMFNETEDILESDDAINLCWSNICSGFSLAVEAIAESIRQTNKGTTNSTTNELISDINGVQLPLAKIIPILNSATSQGYNSSTSPQNLGTALITFYVVKQNCKLLGANVYESFSSEKN